MENEKTKEEMNFSFTSNGSKTEITHKVIESEDKNNNNPNPITPSSEISDETSDDKNNPKTKELSWKINKLGIFVFSGIICVLFLIAVIVFNWLCGVSDDKKKILFFALGVCISLLSFAVAILLSGRVLKPFVKMDFLKELISFSSVDKELIKKYCDTLVEI